MADLIYSISISLSRGVLAPIAAACWLNSVRIMGHHIRLLLLLLLLLILLLAALLCRPISGPIGYIAYSLWWRRWSAWQSERERKERVRVRQPSCCYCVYVICIWWVNRAHPKVSRWAKCLDVFSKRNWHGNGRIIGMFGITHFYVQIPRRIFVRS